MNFGDVKCNYASNCEVKTFWKTIKSEYQIYKIALTYKYKVSAVFIISYRDLVSYDSISKQCAVNSSRFV